MKPVLEILKKNLLSILSGAVAVIAMIALQVPLGGMYTKFQTELNTRAGDYTKANGLLTAKRLLPVVSVGGPQLPLEIFPTPQAIVEAEKARDQVTQQASALDMRVKELNQKGHAVLFADNILPIPGDRVFQYATAYKNEVQNQFPLRLGSVAPPSPEEIKAATDALHDQEVNDKVVNVGGKDVNREQLERDFVDIARRLPAELRQKRATQYKLYMEPGALSVSTAMYDVNRRPLPADIWYAQLGLWIQNDIAGSIAAANDTVVKGNILTDPIKRLVKIDLPQGPLVYVLPVGLTAVDDGTGRDYSRSPSGHYCNSVYDVVQFAVTMDVDQRYIPLIINEFQRDRLTTVLGVDITAVDTTSPAAANYDYGNAPMVQLAITCETLYFRSWTKPLMPEEVKLDLKIPPDAGGTVPVGPTTPVRGPSARD